MKIKAFVAGALMVLTSLLFVACGKAEDGKITTKAPSTSSTTIASTTIVSTTKGGVKEEMSSMADDISDGLSEAGSELKKGLTRMYE